jgi:hypothetical protein
VAGRISGLVSDPSDAFIDGATVILNHVGTRPNKPQPPTTSGFQPYKKIGVVMDATADAGLLRWFNRIHRGLRKKCIDCPNS